MWCKGQSDLAVTSSCELQGTVHMQHGGGLNVGDCTKIYVLVQIKHISHVNTIMELCLFLLLEFP